MNIIDLDKLCEIFWDGNFMEIHKDDISAIPSAFEGMTNGEVLKSIFPTAELILGNSDNMPDVLSVKEKWWNAPYKAESEDKE